MSEFNLKEANKVLNAVANSHVESIDISKYTQEELKNKINDSFSKESIYITHEVLQKGIKDGIIEKPKTYGGITVLNKEKLNEESNSALSYLLETLRKHGHSILYK